MKTFLVRDTITFERCWTIEAESAADAIEIASDGGIAPDDEEQIDCTPYEAEEVA